MLGDRRYSEVTKKFLSQLLDFIALPYLTNRTTEVVSSFAELNLKRCIQSMFTIYMYVTAYINIIMVFNKTFLILDQIHTNNLSKYELFGNKVYEQLYHDFSVI